MPSTARPTATYPDAFSPSSLYLAAFAQAGAPHVGLLIPSNAKSGCLVHIRIDSSTGPNWVYQCRRQQIEGYMFLVGLMKIHHSSDVRDTSSPDGAITSEQLQDIAQTVSVPQNAMFGECRPWVLKVVEKLCEAGLLVLKDGASVEMLGREFEEFAGGDRLKAYARRDRFPEVMVSKYCG
ncbi:hypothetical protein F5I97DRAFT_1814922 [Phlebopus sp. FC_14]|nr:hypothetical protein F5I97DRAFT_1814922 [Phlebopus sp. FC_14]